MICTWTYDALWKVPSVRVGGIRTCRITESIALEYDPRIAPAKGLSSGGKITLLPDLAPAEHFAVLGHEVAHELLHRGDRRKETTHTIRETEVEAVAFVGWQAIGWRRIQPSATTSNFIGATGIRSRSRLRSSNRRPERSSEPSTPHLLRTRRESFTDGAVHAPRLRRHECRRGSHECSRHIRHSTSVKLFLRDL